MNLNVGENLITVTVTAEDESTQTFTVTVTREATSDATLTGLSLVDANGDAIVIVQPDDGMTEGFAAGTTMYTASVEKYVTSITVTPMAMDAGADVVITPADADDATKGHQVEPGTG